MKYVVFDIEATSLEVEKVTRIHCLSMNWGGKIITTNDYDKMRKVLSDDSIVLVGHNIIDYDIPVLERVLDIEVRCEVVDTLALSWGLFPYVPKHGLEWWGERLGFKKVEVDESEWETMSYPRAKERCEGDVEINTRLFQRILKLLDDLYGEDTKKQDAYIQYLMFKAKQLDDQKTFKVPVNRQTIEKNLAWFYEQRKPAWDALVNNAPPKITTVKRKKPAQLYKQDGTLSAHGQRWVEDCAKHDIDIDTEGWEMPCGGEPFNPNSTDQIKDWLFSLGWKPCTYVSRKSKTGVNEVPQVTDDNGELTPSVKVLAEKEPLVYNLENLGRLKHRIGLIKGFLECEQDGYLISSANGFTKTLRLKHKKPIANLPKVTGTGGIEDGVYVRGCIEAHGDNLVWGSDMSSLEERMKMHFIFPYDPDFVREMTTEDWDAHCNLAIFSGAMTEEDFELYKRYKNEDGFIPTAEQKKRLKIITDIRDMYKTGNYTLQFGAGVPKLALTLGKTKADARKVHGAYWDRNWAVKRSAKDATIKKIGKRSYLLNPLNGYYYYLSNEKDIFSSWCQSGGAYVVDIWMYHMKKQGLVPSLSYHDEAMGEATPAESKIVKKILNRAIALTNKTVDLNVELSIDIQIAKTYADAH